MNKRRVKWLKEKVLPTALAANTNPTNSEKSIFREIKKSWRKLPTPEKQAMARGLGG